MLESKAFNNCKCKNTMPVQTFNNIVVGMFNPYMPEYYVWTTFKCHKTRVEPAFNARLQGMYQLCTPYTGHIKTVNSRIQVLTNFKCHNTRHLPAVSDIIQGLYKL